MRDTMRYVEGVEVRAAGDDLPAGHVAAYPTVWGVEYRIGPGLMERIERGAFGEGGGDRPVPLFWQHDWNAGPVGVGNSRSEDDRGLLLSGPLFVEADPRARAVHAAAEAGALEWSIGFLPTSIREERRDDGTIVEVVERAELLEASLVVRGANPGNATVEVRSAQLPERFRLERTEATQERSEGGEAPEGGEAAGAPEGEAGEQGPAIVVPVLPAGLSPEAWAALSSLTIAARD